MRAATLDTEVIIVGGGPAGAATAICLARAGVDVTIVDRAEFPRAKACGDCLSPAATAVLDRLGALDSVLAAAPARLGGWTLRSPSGAMLQLDFPAGVTGLALDRRTLDALLLREAGRAGARLHVGQRVADVSRRPDGSVDGVVLRGADGAGRTLRGKLVVGADGLRSVVAARVRARGRIPSPRKLSFTTHLPGCRIAPAGGPPHGIEVPDVGELLLRSGFCLGLAPVRAGSAATDHAAAAHRPWNVTLVCDAAAYRAAGVRDPGRFFRRAVRNAAGASCEFAWDGFGPELLASGPFERPARRVAGPGWALVGDAAGYYDPFTGQGIYQALAGGELLGGIALGALRRGEVPGFAASWAGASRGWESAHRRLTAPARRLQRLIDAVVTRPALCDLAFARLAAWPALGDALASVTGDLEAPRALLRPDRLTRFAAALLVGGPGAAGRASSGADSLSRGGRFHGEAGDGHA